MIDLNEEALLENKMLDGNKLVEILDSYLKEKKISRRQFCAFIDIPTSTVASWKSKNILPPLKTIVKLAQFMNVSLDWLVFAGKSAIKSPVFEKNIVENRRKQMNRKNDFTYIPCRGKGEFCKELYKEVQIGLRFKQNPDGTVLSVIDKETINFCPFCGRNIRS